MASHWSTGASALDVGIMSSRSSTVTASASGLSPPTMSPYVPAVAVVFVPNASGGFALGFFFREGERRPCPGYPMAKVDGPVVCPTPPLKLQGIHAKRDKLPSIAYSEELIFSRSATLQSTDRHHGIVGQERCHFQLDS